MFVDVGCKGWVCIVMPDTASCKFLVDWVCYVSVSGMVLIASALRACKVTTEEVCLYGHASGEAQRAEG